MNKRYGVLPRGRSPATPPPTTNAKRIRRKKTILGSLPPVLPPPPPPSPSNSSNNHLATKEPIDIYMAGVGVEKIFFRTGDKEVRMTIDGHKTTVKASHNILGWWETIPVNFLITVSADGYSIRQVIIENPINSSQNRIIMDNPTVVRISWEEEQTII